jgi:hypothetical protein
MNNIVGRVVGSLAINATMLNLGILVLCGWFVATRQDIPNLLLGALIANAGNAVGSLSSVLNTTRADDAPAPVNVVNTTADPVAVEQVPAD